LNIKHPSKDSGYVRVEEAVPPPKGERQNGTRGVATNSGDPQEGILLSRNASRKFACNGVKRLSKLNDSSGPAKRGKDLGKVGL
jgi:hypothetical protein